MRYCQFGHNARPILGWEMPGAMAALANPKQEKFCQLVAKGTPVWRAYRDAGYESKTKKDQEVNGFRLARTPHAMARVMELQGHNRIRDGVTVDALAKDLRAFINLSRRVKHPAAGVGAVMALAKLYGLVSDKVEVQQTVVRKPMRTPSGSDRMSIEDWKRQFAPKLDLPVVPASAGDDDEDAA